MADVVVVGGGIAGLSAAAEIARAHRVTVVEREKTLNYHSTSRSAAVYSEPYVNTVICRLSQVSRRALQDPSVLELPSTVLHQRGDLRLYRAEDDAARQAYLQKWWSLCPSLEAVQGDRLSDLVPTHASADQLIGVWDPIVFDIDVHVLCEGFRKQLVRRGGTIKTGDEFVSAARAKDAWSVRTSSSTLRATWLVNAAGAWADDVAMRCGIAAVGLAAKRRTMVQIRPWNESVSQWPMVHTATGEWYLKPQGRLLIVSPADEAPTQPVDARPTEFDVAVAVDRIEQAFSINIDRVHGRWAGLRTFAPDSLPVIGPDPAEPSFIWCAGQGGFGIQTAPAVAVMTAASLEQAALPASFEPTGLTLDSVAPARLRDESHIE